MVSPDVQYHLHMVRIHTHIHITRIWAPYTHTPPQIPRCGIPWMPGHLVVLRITRYGGYIHIRRISYSTGYGVNMHMMSYLLRGIQTRCTDTHHQIWCHRACTGCDTCQQDTTPGVILLYTWIYCVPAHTYISLHPPHTSWDGDVDDIPGCTGSQIMCC